MKEFLMSPKLKIIAITLTLTVVISAAITSSISFFTDSKESTSVYTSGNVYIELSEATVVANENGDLVENPAADRIIGGDINANGATVVNDYGVIFPGQTIHKDPTIKNTGSSPAWVAAKVIIEDGAGDIHKLFGYGDEDYDIDIELFLAGGLLDESIINGTWNGIPYVCYNDNYAMIQYSNRSSGTYEFYFIILNPLGKGESVEIFDTFYIDGMMNNTDMQEFKELKITVQAFAVQTFGFSSCLEAMNEAFEEHFGNVNLIR